MLRYLPTFAIATVCQATLTNDFFDGLQTGARLSNLDQFEEYSCAEPELTERVEQLLGMYNMAKVMIKADNKKSFEFIDKYASELAMIASQLDDSNEDSDFCEGLTVGFKVRQIVTDVGKTMVQGFLQK